MGIIKNIGNGVWEEMKLNPEELKKLVPSKYVETPEEREASQMLIRHLTLGYQTMYAPRVELNDLSVITRMQVDQMAFNTYQPNNGDPSEGDVVNGWRSNAVRPVVRNKCISIAAHATARLIFPKIFAYNADSDSHDEAAKVMRDLMEWAADQSNYQYTALKATIAAIVNPAAFVYSEYGEVYRNVKRTRGEDGKWIVEKMLDETMSGFKDIIIPVDELFIENIYEHDIQLQGWLIWRKVIGYDTARAKYQDRKNWQHVKPGVQLVYSDLNASFYPVYDNNMRTESVEEVTYWNKSLDVKLTKVNNVWMTDCDNPNPRLDKQYPITKMGYELIDEGKFFYYKSLVFKMQSDANIINTLYPMIIDGTYLSIFPAMLNFGSESITSDVLVPGTVTNLTDPNTKFTALETSKNLQQGMNTLMKVDESISESSQNPIESGQVPKGANTAYEISRLEQNSATVMGLFVRMISQFVLNYGNLRVSDILQNMTLIDVDKITDQPELVYKTFIVGGKGKHNAKKIEFDGSLPDGKISEEDMLDRSYDLLRKQDQTKQEIVKVNPRLFRDYKYMLKVSPDVMQPKSDDLERATKLELFDRAIQLGPTVDQTKVAKDFLFGAYKDVRDADEYFPDATQTGPLGIPTNPQMPGQQPVQGAPVPPQAPAQPVV